LGRRSAAIDTFQRRSACSRTLHGIQESPAIVGKRSPSIAGALESGQESFGASIVDRDYVAAAEPRGLQQNGGKGRSYMRLSAGRAEEMGRSAPNERLKTGTKITGNRA
jgi:hypothetical protein